MEFSGWFGYNCMHFVRHGGHSRHPPIPPKPVPTAGSSAHPKSKFLAAMTKHELNQFIDSHEWTYAKTMPHCPHHYVVRSESNDPEAFMRFREFIKTHGFDDRFFRKTVRYLHVGEFKYWICEDSVDDPTCILNRADRDWVTIPHRRNGKVLSADHILK